LKDFKLFVSNSKNYNIIMENNLSTPIKLDLNSKINLLGLSKNDISKHLYNLGIEKKEISMRVQQLFSWTHSHGKKNFDYMTNLSKEFRNLLSREFSISRPQIINKQISNDGTRKYLFKSENYGEFETVFIPEDERGTICISSQIGCTLNCSFCYTGTQKLVRNLEPYEIVGQISAVKDDLADWCGKKNNSSKRAVSNIVVMGMGEPLYNFENIKQGLKIIMDNEGLSISRKKITLSTSGVVPYIHKVSSEIGCLLAVSLHGTTDEVRNELVPINKKWNIQELISTLKSYPNLSNTERITFEYVMIKKVNDSLDDAKRLVKLIKNIPSKINLIPFNPWPGSNYKTSEPETVKIFANYIKKAGYSSPVRKPRGVDIMAACGQLKSYSVREKVLKKV